MAAHRFWTALKLLPCLQVRQNYPSAPGPCCCIQYRGVLFQTHLYVHGCRKLTLGMAESTTVSGVAGNPVSTSLERGGGEKKGARSVKK